ncbi:MAG: GAF domain-containing protein [Chloroflexi bacterium]|nr:GAF domain-containing protein [Chloroflexota bacterium]
MLDTFRKLLEPPVIDGDEEQTRVAGLLNPILLIIIAATIAFLPAMILTTEAKNRLPLLILVIPFITVNTAAYIIMRRGRVLLASYLFLIIAGVGIYGSYALSAPQSIAATLSITIMIAFTALLLDAKAVIRLLIMTIIVTLLVTIAQARGWLTPIFVVDENPFSAWVTNSFIFFLTGIALVLSTVSLRRALEKSKSTQRNLENSNRELNDLRKELEQRVLERTTDIERRAAQLQAVASVTRTIASVQDLDTLLPDVTSLVSKHFGFYHVGIFLVDAENEWAVLRAANSEGGARMMDRHHQLRLDTNSIVGFSITRGEPRIALDVGSDSVYFNNPDLPDTRSEMALPLRVGERVIGALDVQSKVPNAFTPDDISVITTLADLVAIAIENARLFGESQKALRESQMTFDRFVKHEWSSFVRQVRHSGYTFDGKQVTPLSEPKRESVQKPINTGRLLREKASPTVAVPIRLRGQTIGILGVRNKKGSREWTQDELALLEAAAERAALALENARLVESAQRRASRERAIGEISSRIGTFSDMDSILQTAVEELGRKISGATEVTIEIGNENQQDTA